MMAATVLGKRQRGAIEVQVPVLTSSSKKQAWSPRVRQDNQESAVSSKYQLRSRTINDNDPQQENDVDVKSFAAAGVRSKHNTRDDHDNAPSEKINSHFRTSKPINDENSNPVGLKTPQKSRYRDALETSPVTPKHRVQVCAKPLTPRTPRQISAPTAVQTVYTQARQLFARGANAGRIIGRDEERRKLVSFIQDGAKSRRGGCLYVSGPPGTGKSTMVEEVCRDLDLGTVHASHVNCVTMQNARDVYSKLLEDLCEDFQVFRKSEPDKLKEMFIPDERGAPLYLVTLDEIDHLLAADSGVLQSLFEWSLHKKSHLLFIGIANALDLTDRYLPQLKAQNLKPLLLPFLPYNATHIANVITVRLKSLLPADQDVDSNFIPFVQPAAIQLCSKKVASQTGDLRKAFELVKRAIDVIEEETQQKLEKQNAESNNTVLIENANLSSPTRTPSSKQNSMVAYTAVTAPRANVAHVARITSSAFGQGTIQRLQGLNLQQKAAICALIALDKKRRSSDVLNSPSKMRNQAPTVKQVFDTYCTLCRNDDILHPLTATEFKDVLSNLETMGLVGEFQGRGRGGTVVGSSDVRRTPSKSSSGGPSTPVRGLDEKGLVCFVSQKEVEGQISGPGESILRRLLKGEGL